MKNQKYTVRINVEIEDESEETVKTYTHNFKIEQELLFEGYQYQYRVLIDQLENKFRIYSFEGL